jgi:rhodanese-related sulfurtransferase
MKKSIVAILVMLALLLASCTSLSTEQPSIEEKAVVTKITAEEARIRLENEKNIILIDVRTPAEYKEEHILDAILLPLDTISKNAEAVMPDKDAVYFIYCRSGIRSAVAAEQLVEMGYKSIFDLGGIIDWPYEKNN